VPDAAALDVVGGLAEPAADAAALDAAGLDVAGGLAELAAGAVVAPAADFGEVAPVFGEVAAGFGVGVGAFDGTGLGAVAAGAEPSGVCAPAEFDVGAAGTAGADGAGAC